MVKRNTHLAKLQAGYLFPEIHKRKQAYLSRHPDAKVISLGVGDTTLPLDPLEAKQMSLFASGLSTQEGYSGYGPEQGTKELRQRLAERLYQNRVQPNEIFISDGAKCDIARLQLLFGPKVRVAVQDPTYPVYVDTGVIIGQSGNFNGTHGHYDGITYMRCDPNNGFFPNLDSLPAVDLIYFCSPNNPTGVASTRAQLLQLVEYAKKHRAILVFDAAYAAYIRDPMIPHSIYEIPGAREVAIEVNSFSKMAGFTGVRLGWTVVPEELRFEDGSSVKKDWERIYTTCFNGASNIAQHGGLAVLSDEGLAAVKTMSDHYLSNTKILQKLWLELGFPVFGGIHAPYLWVQFPKRKSWDIFEELLEKVQIIATPGSGFGPAGEGFMRFSAFGVRSSIEEAAERLKLFLTK